MVDVLSRSADSENSEEQHKKNKKNAPTPIIKLNKSSKKLHKKLKSRKSSRKNKRKSLSAKKTISFKLEDPPKQDTTAAPRPKASSFESDNESESRSTTEIDTAIKGLIPQPNRYEERSRAICMEFCYFDRDLEVYSEVEGLQKAINGYTIGDDSHCSRNYRGKISNKLLVKDQEVFKLKTEKIIPKEIQEFLLSPQGLVSWAHFTLHEKVNLIKKKYNKHISVQTLQNFFEFHGCKYRVGKNRAHDEMLEESFNMKKDENQQEKERKSKDSKQEKEDIPLPERVAPEVYEPQIGSIKQFLVLECPMVPEPEKPEQVISRRFVRAPIKDDPNKNFYEDFIRRNRKELLNQHRNETNIIMKSTNCNKYFIDNGKELNNVNKTTTYNAQGAITSAKPDVDDLTDMHKNITEEFELTTDQKDKVLEMKYGFPIDLKRPKNIKNKIIAWRIGCDVKGISRFLQEFAAKNNLEWKNSIGRLTDESNEIPKTENIYFYRDEYKAIVNKDDSSEVKSRDSCGSRNSTGFFLLHNGRSDKNESIVNQHTHHVLKSQKSALRFLRSYERSFKTYIKTFQHTNEEVFVRGRAVQTILPYAQDPDLILDKIIDVVPFKIYRYESNKQAMNKRINSWGMKSSFGQITTASQPSTIEMSQSQTNSKSNSHQGKDYTMKSAKIMAVKELISKGELPEDTLSNSNFIGSLFTKEYNFLDLGRIKMKRFLDRWSEAEINRWSQAVIKHGKDFEAITQAMGGTKSYSQCVGRAQQFIQKVRMLKANQGWNKLGEYIGHQSLTQSDLEIYDILQQSSTSKRGRKATVNIDEVIKSATEDLSLTVDNSVLKKQINKEIQPSVFVVNRRTDISKRRMLAQGKSIQLNSSYRKQRTPLNQIFLNKIKQKCTPSGTNRQDFLRNVHQPWKQVQSIPTSPIKQEDSCHQNKADEVMKDEDMSLNLEFKTPLDSKASKQIFSSTSSSQATTSVNTSINQDKQQNQNVAPQQTLPQIDPLPFVQGGSATGIEDSTNILQLQDNDKVPHSPVTSQYDSSAASNDGSTITNNNDSDEDLSDINSLLLTKQKQSPSFNLKSHLLNNADNSALISYTDNSTPKNADNILDSLKQRL